MNSRTVSLALALAPLSVRAAEETAAPAAQLAQVVMGLLLVILLILALAFLLRRLKVLPGQTGGPIRVIGGLSLSTREKLVLVQVGEEQLLLSAGGGAVRTLHKLEKPVTPAGPQQTAGEHGFAAALTAALAGRRA